MKYFLSLAFVFTFFSLFGQNPAAYKIFDAEGEETDYQTMVRSMIPADMVFFGELHNNSIAHWLQLELTKKLYSEKGNKLVLGAEMFEADNQLILDEYLQDIIPTTRFEAECRLWPNYQTDYKPLVEFAKAHQLDFIATNIPRRYANIVSKGGFEKLDSLSWEAKQYIAPLPMEYDPELPSYKDMLNMMGGMGHGNPNLPKAQAAKDATMAFFINENFLTNQLFLHFNGSYHSKNKEGIVWYLKKYGPGYHIITLETVVQDQIDELAEEHLGTADYIIVVDEDVTDTY